MSVYAHPRFAPLPAHARTPKWRDIAAELAQRPGEWAAVAEQIGFRTPLTRRQLNRYGVECAVRTNNDGTATVWMRHIGTQPTATPTPATTGTTYKWFRGERRTA